MKDYVEVLIGEIGLSSKSSYVLSVCVTFWISSVIGDIKLHKTQQ